MDAIYIGKYFDSTVESKVLGKNTDVEGQNPDIMKKLIAAYDQYAQEVGV